MSVFTPEFVVAVFAAVYPLAYCFMSGPSAAAVRAFRPEKQEGHAPKDVAAIPAQKSFSSWRRGHA